MASTAKKTQIASEKASTQYSRLQRLLSFGFGHAAREQQIRESESPVESDDFVDIVLEADFSGNGKVKTVR